MLRNIPVENFINKIPQERLGEYISYQKNAQVPVQKSLKVFHRLSPVTVIPDLIRYPGKIAHNLRLDKYRKQPLRMDVLFSY